MPTVKWYGASPANFTYGRPGRVKKITIHNVGTAPTEEGSAYANCVYFATGSRESSATYFIDNGPIIWQSVSENDTPWTNSSWQGNCEAITIEVCGNGKFTPNEIENLRWLVTDLLKRYGLKPGDVNRHYDYNGKLCPAYYVDWARWIDLRYYITKPYTEEKRWTGMEIAGDNRYGTMARTVTYAEENGHKFDWSQVNIVCLEDGHFVDAVAHANLAAFNHPLVGVNNTASSNGGEKALLAAHKGEIKRLNYIGGYLSNGVRVALEEAAGLI